MNTLAMKKLSSTLTNPIKSNRNLLSLGIFGALDRSRIMNPKPPIVKRKLDASPSIMYCPFTLQKKKSKRGFIRTPKPKIPLQFQNLDTVLQFTESSRQLMPAY